MSVITRHSELVFTQSHGIETGTNIEDVLVVVPPKEYYDSLFAFNASVCYLCSILMSNLIEKRQRQMVKNTFNVINRCYKYSYVSYEVPIDSIFYETFSHLIMWVFSSGLYYKWMDDIYDELVLDNCFEALNPLATEPTALRLLDLTGAWRTLRLGMGLAMVVFVFELCVKRFGQRVAVWFAVYMNEERVIVAASVPQRYKKPPRLIHKYTFQLFCVLLIF